MSTAYTLPPLPYAYDALEPWCNAETLQLHHDKHHKAYVDGSNEAAEAIAQADPGDKPKMAGLLALLEFNLGGHVLHSLFWENLSPSKLEVPASLSARFDADFGGRERAEQLLTRRARACAAPAGVCCPSTRWVTVCTSAPSATINASSRPGSSRWV